MTRKKQLIWGLAALAFYLFLLVANLPARQVLPRLDLPVAFTGLSGTIWQGQAERVSFNGLQIQQLQWRLQFLPLLLGQLSLQLDGGNNRHTDEIAIDGHIALSSSQLESDGLNLYLPTDMLIAQLPLPIPVNAGGRFKVSLDELALQGKTCTIVSGKGQWLNASVAGTQGPIVLGTFDANLGCEQGNTTVQVLPPNSFGLSAKAVVPANMQIKVEGQFKPDASLPQEVHQAAKFFGQPNAQGFYRIAF